MDRDHHLPARGHPISWTEEDRDVSGRILGAVLSVFAWLVHGRIVEPRGPDPWDLRSPAIRRQRGVDTGIPNGLTVGMDTDNAPDNLLTDSTPAHGVWLLRDSYGPYASCSCGWESFPCRDEDTAEVEARNHLAGVA